MTAPGVRDADVDVRRSRADRPGDRGGRARRPRRVAAGHLRRRPEANRLVGGAGADTIFGYAGDDTLSGRGDGDAIAGGAGDDRIGGGDGADILHGRAGWDTIAGGDGDDLVDGGSGRDVLRGGTGADTLIGGNGHDRLVAGTDTSVDVFVFDGDDGRDRIRGFDTERDVVRLDGASDYVLTRDLATGTATIVAGATEIRIGGVFGAGLLVDVVGRNDAPVTEALALGSTGEDDGLVAYDLLAGQRDVEGDALAVSGAAITLRDANGDEIANGDPRWADLAGAVVGGQLAFDTRLFAGLAAGETLTVEVAYGVTDGAATTANIATLDIVGGNDAPTLAGGSLGAVEDSGLVTLDLATLADDGDSDDDAATLTYTLVLDGTVAGVSLAGTVVTLDTSVLELRPGEIFMGAFGVVATDRHGDTASNVVDVTLAGVNDAPVAATDGLTPDADGSLAFNLADLLANDTDAEGDPVTVTGYDAGGLQGSLIDLDDGNLLYVPLDAGDETDTFTYTVSDGVGGTATGTVNLASMFGDRMSIAWDTDGRVVDYREFEVGDGTEVSLTQSDITFDVTADQIIYDYTGLAASYGGDSFNGPVFTDLDDEIPDFASVVISSSNNVFDFDASDISVTADAIAFNFANASFLGPARVVFDVEFA